MNQQNHFVTVMHNGEMIYDISDVEQVPSIGHQLDLRNSDLLNAMYTVVGVTWDLAARSVELDVELTEMCTDTPPLPSTNFKG
jgi:hypothetical protein